MAKNFQKTGSSDAVRERKPTLIRVAVARFSTEQQRQSPRRENFVLYIQYIIDYKKSLQNNKFLGVKFMR